MAEHPTLGRATLAPYDVSSDSAPPRTPEFVNIMIDRRTLPGETAPAVRSTIDRVLAAVLADRPNITATLTLTRAMHAFEAAADAPLVRAVQDVVQRALGR